MVVCDRNPKVGVKLLCYTVMLEKDVEHLQVQLSYMKGQVV